MTSELKSIRDRLKAIDHPPAAQRLVSLLDKQLFNYANEDEAGKAALRPKIERNVRDIERVL